MGFVHMEFSVSLLIVMKSWIGKGGCGMKNGLKADGSKTPIHIMNCIYEFRFSAKPTWWVLSLPL